MLFNGKATSALRERPDCDLCKDAIVPQHKPAAVDGKTRMGPWGYLCVTHHKQHGCGLGEGKGQVLLCGDDLDRQLAKAYRLKPVTEADVFALDGGQQTGLGGGVR